MTARNFAFIGGGLLLVAVFLPIVSLPIVGSVALFGSGSNPLAWSLCVLAAISLFFAFNDFPERVLWPALAALGLVVFAFARLQYDLSQMRAALAEQLADNPFGGIVQGMANTVQLQWGWLALIAGSGLLLFAGVKARRDAGAALFDLSPPTEKAILLIAAVLLVVPVGFDLAGRLSSPAPFGEVAPVKLDMGESAGAATAAAAPSLEEANYIRDNLEIYELEAKYFDGLLEGRVPGVTFKIRNKGDRTLDRVTVVVKFLDAEGQAIAEEEYNPVLVSEYNFSGDNSPLRPNYIWQNESGEFYAAKSVPSEWAAGQASATITEIEFSPDAN